MLEEIRQLFEYERWANRRMLGAVGVVPDEDRKRMLGGSFPTLHHTLAHMLGAQWVWLERWTGSSPSSMSAHFAALSFAELVTEWRRIDDRIDQFLTGATEDRLRAVFRYRSLGGVEQETPLWQTMRHVVNHSSYHRGQVTLMLRQLGAEPVNTDLILFFREVSASA